MIKWLYLNMVSCGLSWISKVMKYLLVEPWFLVVRLMFFECAFFFDGVRWLLGVMDTLGKRGSGNDPWWSICPTDTCDGSMKRNGANHWVLSSNMERHGIPYLLKICDLKTALFTFTLCPVPCKWLKSACLQPFTAILEPGILQGGAL